MSTHERTNEGEMANVTSSSVFFKSFMVGYVDPRKEKQIMLHFVSLAQNNAWPYSGLEVKTTWEKRNEAGGGGYWG